jgi:hypothetical protein
MQKVLALAVLLNFGVYICFSSSASPVLEFLRKISSDGKIVGGKMRVLLVRTLDQ